LGGNSGAAYCYKEAANSKNEQVASLYRQAAQACEAQAAALREALTENNLEKKKLHEEIAEALGVHSGAAFDYKKAAESRNETNKALYLKDAEERKAKAEKLKAD